MKLKLGTRKSLLAWSQSQWVATELERLNPGLSIELVGMETKGDKIQDRPLSQMEGKEFFTAELDQALLQGDTQLTVHSMKDLSLERPPEFALAAIPERELPHDVIIFHDSVMERLKRGKPIRVGTSSPRRLTLLPEFLTDALPRYGVHAPLLEFLEIRGNVNTRLSRVHEPEGHPRKLDAVVLAFAGLERLSLNPEAVAELDRLRQNTLIMVVPVQTFPTAPAQGALAIECRRDQPEVIALIRKLHHPQTEVAIREERKILAEWGGGCHQKLGATYVQGALHIAGKKPNGESVQEKRGNQAGSPLTVMAAADVFDFSPLPLSDSRQLDIEQASHLFFAHARAYEHLAPQVQSLIQSRSSSQHVWVSGWRSWKKLATQGLWIEGCLEDQGYASLSSFKPKHLLGLKDAHFLFFSHDQSGSNPGSELVPTYQHEFREIPAKIWESQQLYWGSGLLFETIWGKLQEASYTESDRDQFRNKQHFCGPGKTRDRLLSLGFKPVSRGDS